VTGVQTCALPICREASKTTPEYYKLVSDTLIAKNTLTSESSSKESKDVANMFIAQSFAGDKPVATLAEIHNNHQKNLLDWQENSRKAYEAQQKESINTIKSFDKYSGLTEKERLDAIEARRKVLADISKDMSAHISNEKNPYYRNTDADPTLKGMVKQQKAINDDIKALQGVDTSNSINKYLEYVQKVREQIAMKG
jgi:hypothetical protein